MSTVLRAVQRSQTPAATAPSLVASSRKAPEPLLFPKVAGVVKRPVDPSLPERSITPDASFSGGSIAKARSVAKAELQRSELSELAANSKKSPVAWFQKACKDTSAFDPHEILANRTESHHFKAYYLGERARILAEYEKDFARARLFYKKAHEHALRAPNTVVHLGAEFYQKKIAEMAKLAE